MIPRVDIVNKWTKRKGSIKSQDVICAWFLGIGDLGEGVEVPREGQWVGRVVGAPCAQGLSIGAIVRPLPLHANLKEAQYFLLISTVVSLCTHAHGLYPTRSNL